MIKMTLCFPVFMVFALSNHGFSQDLSVAELHKASTTATETFKEDYSEEKRDSIYALQIKRVRDGGRVKIFYKIDANPQTIDYFCHFHRPEEMDCHEL